MINKTIPRVRTEMGVLREILLRLSAGSTRLFRNNVGEAWMGLPRTLLTGGIVIAKPVRVKFGLVKGSCDLIGWHSVTVTPDMVGQTVAVFVGIEVKSAQGKVRPEQQTFIDAATAAGARVGVARSVEQAEAILRGER